jgi:hypothetical protein
MEIGETFDEVRAGLEQAGFADVRQVRSGEVVEPSNFTENQQMKPVVFRLPVRRVYS